jgi:hypothetical protein
LALSTSMSRSSGRSSVSSCSAHVSI